MWTCVVEQLPLPAGKRNRCFSALIFKAEGDELKSVFIGWFDFLSQLLVLINEVDKQLFRENNSLLILSHSSAPLSVRLISVMRWQVSFLTPSFTHVHTHTHTHAWVQTHVNIRCSVTTHYSNLQMHNKSLLIEFDPVSWFAVMVVMHFSMQAQMP